MSQQADRAKLYFGFGSNLWRYQMSQRCPESTYLGVARLPKYRWIIYQRGYANVVRTQDDADEVYGLVYSLPPSDEAKLDRNEGVPWAYQKEMMSIEFWQADGESSRVHVGNRSKMEAVSMLVYIDHEGTTEAGPKEEYIYRMNQGIKDAIAAGVPEEYVEKVMRPFIPDREKSQVESKAKKQALSFQDEN